jgi:drug/metabolite transporter (DMT)-like permease
MDLTKASSNHTSKGLIIAAFAAVYIIWGSTYLGIKFAIETLPPFLMSGLRFLIAGLILYVYCFITKVPNPKSIHWKNSLILGALMILCGNGIVVWSEQFIDSNTAALLVTLEPIWIVVLLYVVYKNKPTAVILIGVVFGILGMILLTGSFSLKGFKQVDMRGVLGIAFSTFAWAAGSLYSLKAKIAENPIQATSMQMMTGGLMLLATGTITGEWNHIQWENFSTNSILAFVYLTLFGSLIGYTAYSFLLKHAHPSQVSTYAYVNPVIAVYLGWALADEKITFQTIIASVLLVLAVVIITKFSKK